MYYPLQVGIEVIESIIRTLIIILQPAIDRRAGSFPRSKQDKLFLV
jgi:hypothetical protein